MKTKIIRAPRLSMHRMFHAYSCAWLSLSLALARRIAKWTRSRTAAAGLPWLNARAAAATAAVLANSGSSSSLGGRQGCLSSIPMQPTVHIWMGFHIEINCCSNIHAFLWCWVYWAPKAARFCEAEAKAWFSLWTLRSPLNGYPYCKITMPP